LKIGLLEAWVIFMVLLVVFVPAFSLIFSPPPHIPQECPECPQCPDCECPTPQCPQINKLYGYVVIPPLGVHVFYEEGYYIGEIQYLTYIYPIEGYKYILLVNIPSSRIMYSEWIDWDTFEMGRVDFQEYNSTHSYAYVTEIRFQFNIFGLYTRYEVWNWRDLFMLHVFIVSEDATIHDILE
jgi:hypothetical protein